MACECLEFECLGIAPRIFQCGENILTTLLAGETGIWLMRYEFNGRWFGREITVENGALVSIPNVFNEHYIHKIQFYNSTDELVNDKCYTLGTANVTVEPTLSPIQPAPEGQWGTVTIETDGADSFEVPAGRNIWLVFPGNQGYVRNMDFTQTATTVSMTNGTTFYDGQQILYMYL